MSIGPSHSSRTKPSLFISSLVCTCTDWLPGLRLSVYAPRYVALLRGDVSHDTILARFIPHRSRLRPRAAALRRHAHPPLPQAGLPLRATPPAPRHLQPGPARPAVERLRRAP